MIKFTEKGESDGTETETSGECVAPSEGIGADAGMQSRPKPEALGSLPVESANEHQGIEPDEVSEQLPEATPRKRGRPIAPKPWIDAGVSRMTWYRRQKAKDEP